MSVGGALYAGNSKLFDGPLGVVKVGFKGFDLGKTTADSELVPDQDVKDVLFQQDGTKAADHVRTGIEYLLNVTLGEIKTGLLDLLMAGVSTKAVLPSTDGGTIDRSIYQSMLTDEAGVLRIAAVDENGVPSTVITDIMNFYVAIPIVNGNLVMWGADTQRNFPIQFRIKWFQFVTPTSKIGAFGYWGDPVVEDVPAVVYPDVEAPILVSATVVTATTLDMVFNENIAFQTAFVIAHYATKVQEIYVDVVSGVISLKTLTITYGAATFATLDVVEISVGALELEDTATSANAWDGVDAFPVTNPL